MERFPARRGDTLAKIGERFGVSTTAMVSANPRLKNPNLIYPGQWINVPVVGCHEPSNPAPSTSDAGPSADPLYVEAVVKAVGIPVWGGPFYLYRNVVNGRGVDALVLNRTDVSLAVDPLKTHFFEVRAVSVTRAQAEAAAAAYKMDGAYSYYRGAGQVIFPTIFSDTTAPALCDAMRRAVGQERKDAAATDKLAIALLLWYVGARLPVKASIAPAAGADAVAGSAAAGGTVTSEAALAAFDSVERGIITETRALLKSADLKLVRQAFASGTETMVKVGGREIYYVPDLPASGLTAFGANGFCIGPEAFASEAEFTKTLLHELYRLATSASRVVGVHGELVSAETNAAYNFAERAFPAVRSGL